MEGALPVLAGAAAVLLLLFGLYILLRRAGIRRLTYRREFRPGGVFQGESAELIEEIGNPTRIPLFRVEILMYLYPALHLEGREEGGPSPADSRMQPVVSMFHLPPRTRVRRVHTIDCRRRGYYRLESSAVYIRRDWRSLPSEAELYVYPAPAAEAGGQRPRFASSDARPALRSPQFDPFSFAGIRAYRAGDPLSRLNHKATAHAGALMINEWEPVSGRAVLICLNFEEPEAAEGGYEREMERALSLAAGLISAAMGEGFRVGLAANCRGTDGAGFLRRRCGAGPAHTTELLRALALIRLAPGISFASLLGRIAADRPLDTEIVLLTLRTDRRLEEAAARLRRGGNAVTVRPITDPADGGEGGNAS